MPFPEKLNDSICCALSPLFCPKPENEKINDHEGLIQLALGGRENLSARFQKGSPFVYTPDTCVSISHRCSTLPYMSDISYISQPNAPGSIEPGLRVRVKGRVFRRLSDRSGPLPEGSNDQGPVVRELLKKGVGKCRQMWAKIILATEPEMVYSVFNGQWF